MLTPHRNCAVHKGPHEPSRLPPACPAKQKAPHARGCCHLCLFREGKPSTQMRRHLVTPQGEARFVLELRGASCKSAQPVIFSQVHSCFTNVASSGSLQQADGEPELSVLTVSNLPRGGIGEQSDGGVFVLASDT